MLSLTLFACGSDGDSAEQPSSPAAEGTSAPANVLEEIVQNALLMDHGVVEKVILRMWMRCRLGTILP